MINLSETEMECIGEIQQMMTDLDTRLTRLESWRKTDIECPKCKIEEGFTIFPEGHTNLIEFHCCGLIIEKRASVLSENDSTGCE